MRRVCSPARGLLWGLAILLLMPLALSCQSSEEGTVVVVNLTLPEGATPPADTELLHLETSHDRTRRRTQELQPPAPHARGRR